MSPLATRSFSAAGLLCLCAWSPADIAFAPAKGAGVQKTFHATFELHLDDVRGDADGQQIDMSAIGDPDVKFSADSTAVIADEYAECADGKPLRLLRTFEDLAGTFHYQAEAQGGSDQGDVPMQSDLKGKKVVFAWNEGESRYDVTYDKDASGPEELLGGLSEDMDLRALLPGKKVSSGDSWEVDPTKLADVFFPGGNLGVQPEGANDEMSARMLEELDIDPQAFLAKLLQGKVVATYRGERTEGDAKVAEIALEIDLASSTDLSDLVQKAIETAIELSGEDVPVEYSIEKAQLDLVIKGAGTLLWNAAAGHAHSLEVKAEDNITLDAAFRVEVEGEAHPVSVTVELSGSQSIGLETEGR